MGKKLIIHDLPEDTAALLFEGLSDACLIDAKEPAQNCKGCFDCWLKTPGRCVMRDGLYDIPPLMACCDEMTLISRCSYGGFSPDVKRALDRFIGYVLPYFHIVEGEMHHTRRYDNALFFNVLFYDAPERWQSVASRLVAANALNLAASGSRVRFYQNIEEAKGVLLCV